MVTETNGRSVAKGISWRVVATLVTAIVVFIYSGALAAAAIVGSIDAAAKILLYWGHTSSASFNASISCKELVNDQRELSSFLKDRQFYSHIRKLVGQWSPTALQP